MRTTRLAGFAACFILAGAGAAQAWQPTKPVEFVVTSGAGGGTDNFARMIQSIITKNKLIDQPIVVVNKGGGSGAEGYLHGKAGKSADGLSCSFSVAQGASPAARCAALKRQCGGKFYANYCGDKLLSAM